MYIICIMSLVLWRSIEIPSISYGERNIYFVISNQIKGNIKWSKQPIVSEKEIFPFIKTMNTSSVYLKIETYISHWIPSKVSFKLPGSQLIRASSAWCHEFLKWLPKIKDLVSCVIGEVRVVNKCAAWFLKRLYTEPPNRISTYG